MKTEQIEQYAQMIADQNELFKEWQLLSRKLMHAEVYHFPELVRSLSNLFLEQSSNLEALE
jgi:hypothetical protein